jgi:hypothetical protein
MFTNGWHSQRSCISSKVWNCRAANRRHAAIDAGLAAAVRVWRKDLALPLEIEVGRWPAMFRTIMGSVTLVLALLLLLAAVAPVRELAVAEGQVVPDGSTLPIQHLEGGMVARSWSSRVKWSRPGRS